MADFRVHDGGSVVLLIPVTDAADSWIAENLPADAMRLGNGVAIECRYFPPIADGILNDGLTIHGVEA